MLGFNAAAAVLPTTNFPQFVRRNNHVVLGFNDATPDELCYFEGILPTTYGGGSINVTLVWLSEDQTTGNVRWQVAFERHQDDAFDLDADGFAADLETTATTASVAGETQYTTITFTNAEADAVAAGESFRLRIRREASDTTNDTMTNDAQLLRVLIEEV